MKKTRSVSNKKKMVGYEQFTNLVDKRSDELLHEYSEYADRVQENEGENIDQTAIFESWMIQKLASIQIAFELTCVKPI